MIHKNWEEDVVLGSNPQVPKYYSSEEVWNVDFYGGNIQGIIDKLPYLQSLGITILYLSPIVKSQSTHRYDAADYEEVDPYAGTYEDLKELCREAHKIGMRVVLDAVFNHTGDESKYFDRYHEYPQDNLYEAGAYQNPQSKYKDFYQRDHQGNYSYWWNFTTLPELNCDGSFWKNYICGEGGIIDLWFSCGIDGIRLDVADELSDAALEEIHKAVIRNKEDGFILGEVWENPMRKGRSYISSGKSMHSVMNYPLMDALLRYFKYQDSHKLSYVLRDTQADYPKDTIDTLMNFTSTHDISRAITLFGKKKFDSLHQFSSLDDGLKGRIYECFWEMGYTNDDIYSFLQGSREMNYYLYQSLMERLRGKGVSNDTISYLRSILSYSPFDPYQEWVKDIPKDIQNNLEETRKYHLTKEEYEEAKKLYESYLFFLAAYPGILSIFYGDEAGMEGLNNLVNRRPYPWNREDFELVQFVSMIGQFRKKYSFLKTADFRLLELNPTFVSFERTLGNEQMLVSINNSEEEKRLLLPKEYQEGEKVLTLKKSKKDFLTPYGGVIIKR